MSTLIQSRAENESNENANAAADVAAMDVGMLACVYEAGLTLAHRCAHLGNVGDEPRAIHFEQRQIGAQKRSQLKKFVKSKSSESVEADECACGSSQVVDANVKEWVRFHCMSQPWRAHKMSLDTLHRLNESQTYGDVESYLRRRHARQIFVVSRAASAAESGGACVFLSSSFAVVVQHHRDTMGWTLRERIYESVCRLPKCNKTMQT